MCVADMIDWVALFGCGFAGVLHVRRLRTYAECCHHTAAHVQIQARACRLPLTQTYVPRDASTWSANRVNRHRRNSRGIFAVRLPAVALHYLVAGSVCTSFATYKKHSAKARIIIVSAGQPRGRDLVQIGLLRKHSNNREHNARFASIKRCDVRNVKLTSRWSNKNGAGELASRRAGPDLCSCSDTGTCSGLWPQGRRIETLVTTYEFGCLGLGFVTSGLPASLLT